MAVEGLRMMVGGRDSTPDPDAFLRLVRAKLTDAYRLAGFLLQDAGEAEDAVQDALERAWTAWPRLREPTSFDAWFERIVANVCKDRLRNVANPPYLRTIGATRDWLLAIPAPCLPDGSCHVNDSAGPPQYSTDGVTWKNTDLPDGDIAGFAAGPDRIVLLLAPTGSQAGAPSTFTPYVSTNGHNWTKANMAAGMSEAVTPQAYFGRAGFLLVGMLPDSTGTQQLSGVVAGSWRSWSSRDGINWAPYEPTGLDDLRGYASVYGGSSGDAQPGSHTSDGIHWTKESTPPDAAGGFLSNGSVIVFPTGNGLFASIGDGVWHPLTSEGDFRWQPVNCELAVVPDGLICDSAGHIYHGVALGS